MRQRSIFPAGLKPGDFIQTTDHFGDIYFEVLYVAEPTTPRDSWHVTYVKYGKYAPQPATASVNAAGEIRRILPAEMAIPIMVHKRLRFSSTNGQYDPLLGYAPVGKPLRTQ